MNIRNHAIKPIAVLLITMSFCVNADVTEQEERCMNDTLAGYDIERLTEVGTTAEEVFLFSQKAPMVSPYEIHRFTQRNITPEVVASFHPKVANDPAFIDEILEARLSPQTANSYLEVGINGAFFIIKYAKNRIPPDLAGSLYKNLFFVISDSDRVYLQDAFKQGLKTEDLPRYKGLAYSSIELKTLYISKVPVDFIHEAKMKDIDLFDAISLYFRGIDLDTYSSLTSDQQTCTVYPTSQLHFEHLGNLAGYQSKKEPIALPKALFSKLNSIFIQYDMYHFSLDDHAEIFKYVEKAAKDVKKPTIYNLLHLTAKIVSEKLHYELVDDGELALTFPEGCSIAEYWRRGMGDCDKYMALGVVVFAQLKQLFPDVLANVYLTKELFSKYPGHTWNTVVIAEEDRLIFTHIDITDSDPDNAYFLHLILRFLLQLHDAIQNLNEASG
ncbi:hypothetical protein, partial [Endozoicomonas sp. SESOKO4]|uniref:hypothetical protein n=1 Tax=Endozoicomonas sp. SESOKO4 TaxID=2828745 RepID=UPI002148CF9F